MRKSHVLLGGVGLNTIMSEHPALIGISVLDLSAYVGLIAVGVGTFNMLLGMLMAIRYSPVRSWPHRRFNYFRLHTWSGYVALSVSILHPLILLLNKPTRFRMVDVVYPVHSPSQPLENTVGAVAVVHSYDRSRHFLFARSTRPAALEIFTLHHLFRGGRAFLA
jgi:predicted ferric reductase